MSQPISDDAIRTATRQLWQTAKGRRTLQRLADWLASDDWCVDDANQQALQTLIAEAQRKPMSVEAAIRKELEIPF